MMLRPLLAVCLFACSAVSAWADELAPSPAAVQAARFGSLPDLRTSPDPALRHPQRALDLADALADPEFLVTAMMMSSNPEAWLKAMERVGAPKNLARTASPEMLADWLYSSIDPQFQQAILSRMLNPNKSQRWMQAMSDPRFYMPALAMMSPGSPIQWTRVTADGRLSQSTQAWSDPKTCFNWMRLPLSFPSAAQKGGEHALASIGLFRRPPQRY